MTNYTTKIQTYTYTKEACFIRIIYEIRRYLKASVKSYERPYILAYYKFIKIIVPSEIKLYFFIVPILLFNTI